jgi:hypothetical protein
MFNLIITLPGWKKLIEGISYKEAQSQQEFYQELYPDAAITIEPSF